MKKLVSVILIILSLFVAVNAESNIYLYDDFGYDARYAEHSKSLEALSQKHGVPVYVAITNDFSGDIDSCADNYYASRSLGAGDSKAGILLYVDPIEREYSIYVHGTAQDIIDSDAFDYIENAILPPLEDTDFSLAITEFNNAVDFILTAYSGGERYKEPFPLFLAAGVSIFIGILIGLISVFIIKGNMKSVRSNDSARGYTVENSFKLNQSRDIFLYRTVTRIKRPENNSNGGARPSASGGSFSSRSGKF